MNMKMKVWTWTCVLSLACAGLVAQQKTCGGRVKLENIWKVLVSLHDKDKDGKITQEEFTRGAKAFGNHDRNRDGVITAADFPVGRFWNGFGPGVARRADRDRDQKVTKAEWQKFVAGLDADDDGIISMPEFARVGQRVPADKASIMVLMLDQDGDGKIEVSDFDLLFVDLDRNGDGELDAVDLRANEFLGERGGRRVPRKGDVAPDFDLPRCDDPKKSVRLSSFRGKKPVALIFGSYT